MVLSLKRNGVEYLPYSQVHYCPSENIFAQTKIILQLSLVLSQFLLR